MTDKQKFIDFFGMYNIKLYESNSLDLVDDILEIRVGDGTYTTGYQGFFTEFIFNKDGTFKKIGIWEE